MSEIIKKTSPEVRAAIKRRTAAMLPDRPSQQGFKPADIRAALYEAIISSKGPCLMGELDRVVEEFNLHLSKAAVIGSLTIEPGDWQEESVALPVSGLENETVCVLFPLTVGSRKALSEAEAEAEVEIANGVLDQVVLIRGSRAPDKRISLGYLLLVGTPAEPNTVYQPMAVLVGTGVGGGGSGEVDEEAVRTLISEIVPAWALEEEAPIPDADPPGTAQGLVKGHNESDAAHQDIRELIRALAAPVSVLIGGDTGKSVREIAALVIAEALREAPESLNSLEEMAAWIEAHPKDAAELAARIKTLEDEMTGKVSEDELAAAIEEELAASQESGAFTGRRGYSILRVSSSTTSASGTGENGAAIKYKIALSKVCSEAGVEAVYVGDTVFRASVYMYPVVKVDESYVYLGAYTSVKGSTGPKGATGDPGYSPVRGIDYWKPEDQAAMLADVLAALPVYSGEVTEV